jgi:uncharacterized protein (DUF1697 family)
MLKLDWGEDSLAVGRRAAYIWCADGILASRLFEAVSRAMGDAVTSRNWSTMKKLHAMTEGQE